MKAIIRLAASRRNLKKRDLCAGFEAGKRWAKREADWRELQAVVDLPKSATLKHLESVVQDDEALHDYLGVDPDELDASLLKISKERIEGFILGARAVHRKADVLAID
jgi:hypothetical protein